MLVGHESLIKLFKRLAEEDLLASCYIFFGPAQVGKRTFAESLANYIEKGEFIPPPHVLQETLQISVKDEAVGIEAIRKIKAFLSEKPIASQKRIVIIDNAENLTLQAENALLKISEEPPKDSLIILVLKSPDVLLSTLVSRFQKIYFPTLSRIVLERILEDKGVRGKEKEEFLKQAGGSPGKLIVEIEEQNSAVQDAAKKIRKATQMTRSKIIKEYLDSEESPLALADAIILDLFTSSDKPIVMILRALKAKRELSSPNLNPRLQLESIFS